MTQSVLCGLLVIFAAAPARPSVWKAGTVTSMKVADCTPTTNAPKDKEMPCHEYVIRGATVTYRVRTTQQRVTVTLPPGQKVEYHAYGSKMDVRVPGAKRGHSQSCVIISHWENSPEKR